MSVRSVFITGASSGLGRGLALHYANAGATVFAAARRVAELESLAQEVSAGAGRIVAVALDVGDLEALSSSIARAESESGGALDLVIANAGIGIPTDARNLDWRAVERVFHVNTSAACTTVSAALPAMVAKNTGTVVAVASLAGFRGMAGHAAYCASKAALRTFMESLRVDLRGTGVRALTIYPGFVRTEMTAKNRFPMPFILDADEAVRVMVRGIARGKRSIAYPLPLVLATRWMATLPDFLYEFIASKLAPQRLAKKRKSN